MTFKIKIIELDGGVYASSVDWDKGDAGKSGTPGAVKYAYTEPEAYLKMYEFLKERGHDIIEGRTIRKFN